MSKGNDYQENILGRNIQHLRKMHGETLAELGESVHLRNTAIKNYESGERDPKPQVLAALAKHYGKTVDELLNCDLTELGDQKFSIHGLQGMIELWKILIPLSSSDAALQNNNFKKAYEKCCSIMESFSKNEPVMGRIVSDCFDLYSSAAEEDDLPEAAANIMWLLFLEWSQILDKNMMEAFTSILYPRTNQPSSNKIIMRTRNNTSEDVIEKRKRFIDDLDDAAMEIIKELKHRPGWENLGDYYLGLKYLTGMVDSGLSQEMNEAVGMQMLISQVHMDNIYAINMLTTMMTL
ncbi:MAG: helix-turn-helix transcriptional regulator [Lachnospiraceae bacterium]|nr:helix-turn-helix transcriptional regulator [Lachnospiraceae bacterium]